MEAVCEQPADQVSLMSQMAADLIEYAHQLQETQQLSDPHQRAAAIQRVKASFPFADISALRVGFPMKATRVGVDALCC